VTDPAALLVALQLGDSFFPSGMATCSFGLEGLRANGRLETPADVEELIAVQLEERWAPSDRVALLHAHAAAGNLDAVAHADHLLDRSIWAESLRFAGRRMGRALLAVHRRLGTRHAAAFEARVREGGAVGQASAVQGLLAQASGLSAEETVTLAAYGIAAAMVSAALRLGAIGHIEAQRILLQQRDLIVGLVELPLVPLVEMSAWTPVSEIASMQREAHRGRLFSN
jgi:urease accessory protein